jgi:hypothetical protein
MKSETQNPLEIESVEAYVVYHPEQGDIVHVHRAFSYRGAQRLPTGEAGRERALEMAARFGHRTEGLRVLTVPPDALETEAPLRVDVTAGELIAGTRGERKAQ